VDLVSEVGRCRSLLLMASAGPGQVCRRSKGGRHTTDSNSLEAVVV